MEKIIDVKNVTKKYGKIVGIDNLSIEISKGEVLGFIGPNGAGKSTTIKCIMDLININDGNIYIANIQVKRDNTKLKEKIGYLPSEIHLYEDGTFVKDNYTSSSEIKGTYTVDSNIITFTTENNEKWNGSNQLQR